MSPVSLAEYRGLILVALKAGRPDIPTARARQLIVKEHEGKVRDAFVRRRNPVDIAKTLSRKEPFHHQHEEPTLSDSSELSQGEKHENPMQSDSSSGSPAA